MAAIKFNQTLPSKEKVKVTGEQLKDFVCGAQTFSEMSGEMDNPDFITLVGGDGYHITLEDLTAGVQHYLDLYREGTLDIDAFFDDWLYPLLYCAGDILRIPEMIGEAGKTMDDIDLSGSMFVDPFFKDRTALAFYVVSRLFDCDLNRWETFDDPSVLEETLLEILEVIDNYPQNEGKKKAKWKLTREQIKNFVYTHDDDNDMEGADEETIAVWKKYLEEMAAQDDVQAVKILGYACYGDGHYVYKCDWARSRDCMLKLMEIGDDRLKAQAANTLGYIYYYGRTTKGKPDYDAAYRYFSLAAFFGYYEAIYKVGDMIMSGKGTPKNETAAFRMYEFVYNDCYQQFLDDGVGSNFADAALRLGGAYHKGKGTYQDPMQAYRYYLQARLAIDNRMRRSNFFGDTSVSASIRNAISEVRKELGDACRQKKQAIYLEKIAGDVFAGVSAVRVKVERKKTETSITFHRVENFSWDPEPNILVTIPQISYCVLSPDVKVSAPAGTSVEFKEAALAVASAGINKALLKGTSADQTLFYADEVRPMYAKGKVHFYLRRKLVMAVDMSGWYIKALREKGSDKMHKFVGICFEGNERVYDYLCDGQDIRVGDYVIVPSYDGPVKVKAVRVYEQSEADAPLEITKYKKAEKAE